MTDPTSTLKIAKQLIEEKHFDEARAILKKLDHPTATRWLAKLDEIAPPPKPQKQKQKFSPLLLASAGAGLLVLLIFLVFVLSNRVSGTPDQTHVSADGTFSFRYPDGWNVQDFASHRTATISNPEGTLHTEIRVVSLHQTGLVANPINPVEAVREIVVGNELGYFVTQLPIELSLDGKPAARVLYSKPPYNAVIYFVDIGEGEYARIEAKTVEEELDKYLSTIETIAGSIQLQPNFRLSRDLTSTSRDLRSTSVGLTLTWLAAERTHIFLTATQAKTELEGIFQTMDAQFWEVWPGMTMTAAQNSSYSSRSTATPPAPQVVSAPTVVPTQTIPELTSEGP